jgi:hypothetical protein
MATMYLVEKPDDQNIIMNNTHYIVCLVNIFTLLKYLKRHAAVCDQTPAQRSCSIGAHVWQMSLNPHTF